MNRGDVILIRFPHPSGMRGKKRPAVVVQANSYNQTLHTAVVAEVTKNLTMANDPACLFIDINTPDGQQTGLPQDSVVSACCSPPSMWIRWRKYLARFRGR
jgi:mRNA interferase MazF